MIAEYESLYALGQDSGSESDDDDDDAPTLPRPGSSVVPRSRSGEDSAPEPPRQVGEAFVAQRGMRTGTMSTGTHVIIVYVELE